MFDCGPTERTTDELGWIFFEDSFHLKKKYLVKGLILYIPNSFFLKWIFLWDFINKN